MTMIARTNRYADSLHTREPFQASTVTLALDSVVERLLLAAVARTLFAVPGQAETPTVVRVMQQRKDGTRAGDHRARAMVELLLAERYTELAEPALITHAGEMLTVRRVSATASGHRWLEANSINPMQDTDPGIPAIDPTTPATGDRTRALPQWVAERVVELVRRGEVWADNRRRNWRHKPDSLRAADYLSDSEERTLSELRHGGFVRIDSAKRDMPAPDQRTLRVRQYRLTTDGTRLAARWAGLRPYTP